MTEMKEIVQWLLTVELKAGTFYNEASKRLEKDERVSKFFLHLAEEEARHFQVMKGALEYLENHGGPSSAIIVDTETKEKIEVAFEKNTELLHTNSGGTEDILHCLAITEFSEWNHIFMYVVNSLREERQFMPVAAGMQHHVKEIETFLDSLPEGRKHLHIIKGLPRVWKEQILIIDDDPGIVQFLKMLFSDMGEVETAFNGTEGLKKVKEKHFDVIICDVQMPVMDGLAFYNAASAIDTQIGQRIIFFTGSAEHEHTEFFRARQLRYLMKPAPITEILRIVSEIMPAASD